MAMRAGSRNNLLAGTFVIAGVALAVVMSVVIAGAQEWVVARTPYVVRFTIGDGAAGIQPGSPITLGGQKVGRVSKVRFVPSPSDPDAPIGIDVTVLVRSDVKLYEDATVSLERPLLGSYSVINIASVGTGQSVPPGKVQGGSALLERGETVAATLAPPTFLAQAGYGPDEIALVKRMISQAADAVDKVAHVVETVDEQTGPLLESARKTMHDAEATAAEVREKMPGWTRQIDSTLDSVSRTAEKAPGVVDEASAAVGDARKAIGSVQEAIDTNRPGIDRTMANIEGITAEFKDKTLPDAEKALQGVQSGVESFASAGRQIETTLTQELPGVARMLANARLASEQLKLALIEIRRTPWRLLYSPKTKELESELFYDAARTYAEAVSDLRAASESLEAVAKTGSPPGLSRETVEHMTTRLADAFKQYQEAEKKLMEQLVQRK